MALRFKVTQVIFLRILTVSISSCLTILNLFLFGKAVELIHLNAHLLLVLKSDID